MDDRRGDEGRSLPRLIVVSGPYGVGKSEFSVALALTLKRDLPGKAVTLIDLDVVNPYFRSREARHALEEKGITVIGNSLGIDAGVDLPAIPGSVAPTLRNPDRTVIVDLGGDPVGGRALRQFRPYIPTEDTALLYVFNVFRLQNADAGEAESVMRGIEDVTGLRCGGIVNNTHLLGETSCEHLKRGDEAARALSQTVNIPIFFYSGRKELLERCTHPMAGAPLYIDGLLRQSWMS